MIAKDTQVDHLINEVEAKSKEMDKIEARLQSLHNSQDSCNNVLKENENLRNRSTAKENEVANLNTQIQLIDKSKEILQEELLQSRSQTVIDDGQILQHQETVQHLNAELEILQSENHNLKLDMEVVIIYY